MKYRENCFQGYYFKTFEASRWYENWKRSVKKTDSVLSNAETDISLNGVIIIILMTVTTIFSTEQID